MPEAVSNHSSKLKWQSLESIARPQRPHSALQVWLNDSGSLTARLIAQSKGNFRVQVVRQVIGCPTLNERQVLRMKQPALALIREVILLGHGEPWVFARSIMPLTSLTGALRHLRKQNNRPLGAFLFSQPKLQRSAIAVARISHDHAYVPDDLLDKHLLWGRRSVFYLQKKPLLVSEVFLPAFTAQLDHPDVII